MSRLVMSTSGQLRQLTCLRVDRNWSSTLDRPKDQSDVYAICGAFGIVNKTSLAPCQCLQGFEESSANNCVRKTSLQCENSNSSNGKRDGFLKIPNVELPADSKAHPDQKSKKSCKLECFRKCSCTAYAYNDDEGCSSWEGGLFGVQQLSDKDNNAQDLYLKLAASDIPKDGGNKKILWVAIAVVVSAAVLVSGGFICIRKKLKQRGEKNSSKDLLSYDFNGSSSANDDETDIDNLRRGASKDVDLPFFSFASVSEATSNFSAENKLGEGGFGPVTIEEPKKMILRAVMKILGDHHQSMLKNCRRSTQLRKFLDFIPCILTLQTHKCFKIRHCKFVLNSFNSLWKIFNLGCA